MSGTTQLLSDLYDCPESYPREVGQQKLALRNVWLSILAASQTDWFLERVKQADFRGGFLARFTYWPAGEQSSAVSVPVSSGVADTVRPTNMRVN